MEDRLNIMSFSDQLRKQIVINIPKLIIIYYQFKRIIYSHPFMKNSELFSKDRIRNISNSIKNKLAIKISNIIDKNVKFRKFDHELFMKIKILGKFKKPIRNVKLIDLEIDNIKESENSQITELIYKQSKQLFIKNYKQDFLFEPSIDIYHYELNLNLNTKILQINFTVEDQQNIINDKQIEPDYYIREFIKSEEKNKFLYSNYDVMKQMIFLKQSFKDEQQNLIQLNNSMDQHLKKIKLKNCQDYQLLIINCIIKMLLIEKNIQSNVNKVSKIQELTPLIDKLKDLIEKNYDDSLNWISLYMLIRCIYQKIIPLFVERPLELEVLDEIIRIKQLKLSSEQIEICKDIILKNLDNINGKINVITNVDLAQDQNFNQQNQCVQRDKMIENNEQVVILKKLNDHQVTSKQYVKLRSKGFDNSIDFKFSTKEINYIFSKQQTYIKSIDIDVQEQYNFGKYVINFDVDDYYQESVVQLQIIKQYCQDQKIKNNSIFYLAILQMKLGQIGISKTYANFIDSQYISQNKKDVLQLYFSSISDLITKQNKKQRFHSDLLDTIQYNYNPSDNESILRTLQIFRFRLEPIQIIYYNKSNQSNEIDFKQLSDHICKNYEWYQQFNKVYDQSNINFNKFPPHNDINLEKPDDLLNFILFKYFRRRDQLTSIFQISKVSSLLTNSYIYFQYLKQSTMIIENQQSSYINLWINGQLFTNYIQLMKTWNQNNTIGKEVSYYAEDMNKQMNKTIPTSRQWLKDFALIFYSIKYTNIKQEISPDDQLQEKISFWLAQLQYIIQIQTSNNSQFNQSKKFYNQLSKSFLEKQKYNITRKIEKYQQN